MMHSNRQIRPLLPQDRSAWNDLWHKNTSGLKADDISEETWNNLMNPEISLFGICVIDNGGFAGFLHYALHPLTGFRGHACYMQDVFVAESYRRKGLGRDLIAALQDIGRQQGWVWIHWFANEEDDAVKNFYQPLGTRNTLSLHIIALQGTNA